MIEQCAPPASRRFLGTLIIAGLVWRLVIVSMTPVPREDGVNYLWMAQQFAAGEAGAALSEIFSPLLALVIAVPITMGIDPLLAGQLMLALVGAFVVVPVVRLSEVLCAGGGRCAGCLVFVANRPVTLGAQIYTEPLFLLVGGYAFLFGVRRRYWLCGTLSGIAFWIRPEAALIPLAFFCTERRSWVAFVPTLVAVALLALWRGSCGEGFDPVPKLQFIMAHNVAGDTDAIGFALRSLRHLLDIPWLLVEAFGVAALLAVYGAFHRRPPAALWLLLFAVVVICAYVPRWRFLVNWLFVIAPFAAAGLNRIPGRRWLLPAIVILNLVLALQGGVRADRIAERVVAEHLREQLRPGEVITGDMTRVLYFAGFRPLPPRHFTARELIAAGRRARFVVLRSRRGTTPKTRAGLPDHVVVTLPGELADLAKRRGMIVLESDE